MDLHPSLAEAAGRLGHPGRTLAMIHLRIPRRARLLAAANAASGCGSLLGVDGYEPVACVERCETAEAGSDGAAADGSSVTDASATDASATAPSTDAAACTDLLPCPDGYRIAIHLVGTGSAFLSSDPGGISVRPGETASACFRGRLRLEVSGGIADFVGASCEDGTPTSECEIQVSSPACITVTLR
jgi:hypothetical protein